jgi:hypothetical protein
VTGGFEAVYGHEQEWAEIMFKEWNADGVKVDHMCQVVWGTNISLCCLLVLRTPWGTRMPLSAFPCCLCAFRVTIAELASRFIIM